ncbi:hypothetical protein PtA15_8A623 [Puccinia triticina]|uniref:Uncharacterized protein n=1 Tax=Puccinia triticina TaxID=208348 RepID=A0ABY7CYC2_9BASI|nr:uncharacterized protein PtA15_8A623 [Puccinia triticina]WAQ87717.1 hypothetical protein PtA15_8A623 [Puccinia triticina]
MVGPPSRRTSSERPVDCRRVSARPQGQPSRTNLLGLLLDTSLANAYNPLGTSTASTHSCCYEEDSTTPTQKRKMPADLRKRKPESGALPSTVSNPRPKPNEVGHAASNRQKPTIAPTVFMLLIVGLMFALFPIFYYTQVMIPDPESKSILSNFRNKGNIILNALGHTSSAGDGRIPFNAEHQSQPPIQPASQTNHNLGMPAPTEEARQSNETGTMSTISDPATTATQSETEGDKETLSAEKQKKLDEELGLFWEASSRYRREAQKQKAGQYSLQGDGTSASKGGSTKEEEQPPLLDLLPDADPDAKEGLTPEFWDAIKDQFSADDLTVVLNDMRRTEQTAEAKTH